MGHIPTDRNNQCIVKLIISWSMYLPKCTSVSKMKINSPEDSMCSLCRFNVVYVVYVVNFLIYLLVLVI